MIKKEILENYKKQLIEEQKEKLERNSTLINDFIKFCKSKNILLTIDNFQYIQTIGIIATYPDIVKLLNNKILKDKEGLVSFKTLNNELEKRRHISGFLYADKYMVMAHPYFRRGHSKNNNFSPRFIDIFWNYDKLENDNYIAIDFDRVRINVDNSMYMELDTWYGAKFNYNISEIEDGIVKLRPPLDLEPFHINSIFNSSYSLDIKWTTKEHIRIFQAEEFKTEECKIEKTGKYYFPAKYVHSEYDTKKNNFRHFDGSIHFYTEEEYYTRRESDFNYNNKNDLMLKSQSQKLFKINGQVNVNDWVELTSHFLSGNPLIIEYFEGNLPERINEMVDKIRMNNNIST